MLYAYETDYKHLGALLRPDEQTAVLYNLNGFRVYSLFDGTFEKYDFPDADNVRAVYYLRNPQISRGEPEEECLLVLHYDGSSVYYSPQDCRELASRTVQADDADSAAVSFQFGSYRVEQTDGGTVTLYRKGGFLGEWKSVDEWQSALLIGVSPWDEGLIVALRNSDRKYYSLLLDKKTNTPSRRRGC